MKKFKKHTLKQIVGKPEQEVTLKAEGKTNTEVAQELQISVASLSCGLITYSQMDRAQARELKRK